MSQTSLWKIKRELQRLRRNGPGMATELVRKLYFRRYYDLVTSRAIKRSVGAVPLGRDVAIYLIFPSSGVLTSHLYMLQNLRKSGISPIVVSNIPLTAPDRAKLSDFAARIIERPNTGYDFGGYRDGVLEVSEHLAKLDRVWLINDSVWLVPQAQNWFEQVRTMKEDFVAATSNFSIFRKSGFRTKHVYPSEYRSIAWRHETHNPNFHYASYALSIGSAILSDPRFLAYWKKLEIRNDKKRTVRRGEIGLTQWVLSHGYSHAATHEIYHLDQELAALGDADLDLSAREVILLDDQDMVPIKKQVLTTDPTSTEGRAERIGFILTAAARRGSAYALAIYNIRRHRFPFMKKSPRWLSPEGSDVMLGFIDNFKDQEGAYILKEAQLISNGRGGEEKSFEPVG